MGGGGYVDFTNGFREVSFEVFFTLPECLGVGVYAFDVGEG